MITEDCQAYQTEENCFTSCDNSQVNFSNDRRYHQNPDTSRNVNIPADQFDTIKTFILEKGSLAAAMLVESEFYGASGVYTTQVSGSGVNHVLVVVGWDANGNWIAKNSWGTGWGDSGWIKFPIGQNVINEMSYGWMGIEFPNSDQYCDKSIDSYGNCVDDGENPTTTTPATEK